MATSRMSSPSRSIECLDAATLRGYIAGTLDQIGGIVAHVEHCEACRRRVALAVRAARRQVAPITSAEAWLAIHRSVRPVRDLRKRSRR